MDLDSKANSIRLKEIILFAVLISTLGIFMGKYSYGVGNHIEQLPMIFRLLDSSYLTQDFFVNASTDFGPRFYYSKLLAILGFYCPLPILFLLLTWLANVLVVLVTYFVARDLFRGSNLTAMMACTLVMGVNSIGIGGAIFLHLQTLIPGLLALPLALLSLWAGIRQQPLICGVSSAFASLIHPLIGLETGAIALATVGLSVLFRLDNEYSPRKAFIKMTKVVSVSIVFAVFAVFVWIIPQNSSIDSTQFINIVAYFRHPHHYIPSTFGVREYIATLFFLLAFAISWKWWYDNLSTDKTLPLRILIPIIIVLSLCVGGYLFVEVFPSRLWTTVQAFRLLFIVKWFGLIVLAGTIARFLKRSDAFDQSYVGWMLLIGSGGSQPLLMFFGHTVELFRERLESILPPRGVHLGLGVALLVAGVVVVKFGSLQESFALLLFVVISFWFLLLLKRWYRSLIPSLLLCIVIVMFTVNRHYQIPFLSDDLGVLQPIVTLSDIKGPDVEIADYARENIREDAVFLTPPLFGRFRLVARRAIVVDFKSFPFQDWAMVEWKKRMLDCYGKVENTGFFAATKMDELYKNIAKEKILYIAKKYRASYAILYKDTPSEFPAVFENDSYKIVKISADGK